MHVTDCGSTPARRGDTVVSVGHSPPTLILQRFTVHLARDTRVASWLVVKPSEDSAETSVGPSSSDPKPPQKRFPSTKFKLGTWDLNPE